METFILAITSYVNEIFLWSLDFFTMITLLNSLCQLSWFLLLLHLKLLYILIEHPFQRKDWYNLLRLAIYIEGLNTMLKPTIRAKINCLCYIETCWKSCVITPRKCYYKFTRSLNKFSHINTVSSEIFRRNHRCHMMNKIWLIFL